MNGDILSLSLFASAATLLFYFTFSIFLSVPPSSLCSHSNFTSSKPCFPSLAPNQGAFYSWTHLGTQCTLAKTHTHTHREADIGQNERLMLPPVCNSLAAPIQTVISLQITPMMIFFCMNRNCSFGLWTFCVILAFSHPNITTFC